MSTVARRVIATALALCATTVARAQGVTVVYRTTMVGSGLLTSVMPGGTSRLVVEGDRSRLERDDSVAPAGLPAHSVTITRDGRSVMLDVARREYFVLDVAGGLRRVADVQRAAGVAMRITDSDVRVEHVGAGDTVVGRPTDRWRVTCAFTLILADGGTETRYRSTATTEYWFSDLPDGNPTSSVAMADAASFSDSAYARKLAAVADTLPRRITLRWVMTASTSVSDGPELTHLVTTSEAVQLSRGPVPPDAFEIPAGYREVPQPSGAP
jgi:hypothetical protein